MHKRKLKVAMIGYGFMGKAHSTAFLEAQRIFDLPFEFEMSVIAGLSNFENGAMGVFESTRMATGRMVNNFIEINGSDGALWWDFEDMNSLNYYDNCLPEDRRGFAKIQALTGEHAHMQGNWSCAHAQGYANTFINALKDFAFALEKDELADPNFYDGVKNQEVLDAVVESHERKKWVNIGRI